MTVTTYTTTSMILKLSEKSLAILVELETLTNVFPAESSSARAIFSASVPSRLTRNALVCTARQRLLVGTLRHEDEIAQEVNGYAVHTGTAGLQGGVLQRELVAQVKSQHLLGVLRDERSVALTREPSSSPPIAGARNEVWEPSSVFI